MTTYSELLAAWLLSQKLLESALEHNQRMLDQIEVNVHNNDLILNQNERLIDDLRDALLEERWLNDQDWEGFPIQ